MSELDEADLQAAAQQEGGDELVDLDAEQQPEQPKPVRRGRLAATAAVAAATNTASGDNTVQALSGLQDGGAGYEDVEEEEDPEKEVLAFEIKASDVSMARQPVRWREHAFAGPTAGMYDKRTQCGDCVLFSAL
jgi:hypothetical protein